MSSAPTDHPFSVPRYPSGQPCPAASEHLLVTQGAEPTLLGTLAKHVPVSHLALPDFPHQAALQAALRAKLDTAPAGLRLELHGDEAFVWPLHALARQAGLQADEIILHCPP